MQITYLGHSSVLVEAAGARLLIDPGAFSKAWHGLTDIDAVLVTHQHPDHIDAENIPALIAANPAALWFVEPSVVPMVPAEHVAGLPAGASVSIGDVTVSGVGGRHAVIHADLPDIGNTGLVLRAPGEPSLFHPGDSYAAVPQGIDLAFVPLNAPWAKLGECVDFIRALGPQQWFPIHDALLSPRGRALYLDRTSALAGIEATDLAALPRYDG